MDVAVEEWPIGAEVRAALVAVGVTDCAAAVEASGHGEVCEDEGSPLYAEWWCCQTCGEACVAL